MELIARLICERENLPFEELAPLQGGQVNAAYQVGKSRVLRLAREAEGQRLQREARLLRELAGMIPVPEVLAVGRLEGVEYQVSRLAPGIPLHRIWTRLSALEQDRVAAQLAESLQALHALSHSRFGLLAEPQEHKPTWRELLVARFQRSAVTLRRLPGVFPAQILDAVEAHFLSRQGILEAESAANPALVHHDLWPGNILVEEGKITAILDFEFATWAPPEYELVLIEQLCLYPNAFVEPGQANFACSDFSSFISRLRSHYPALFAAPGLRQRLDLYHIEYVLRAYLAWIERQAAMHARLAVQPVAKVMNFLFEDGVRMFDQ
jgi:aminoglycoside phosphotransferase (APT) family kinase protein